MLAREVSSRAYQEIGVSDSHHPLSHHQNEAAKLERLHKVNEYHVQQFAHLVGKLAAIPEGDGTMLDHSLFMYGTGISDSNTHFHDEFADRGDRWEGRGHDGWPVPAVRGRHTLSQP